MVNKSKFNGGNGNAPSSRNNKKKYNNYRKKSVASSVRCENFGIARTDDDEKQVSMIFDKMNHLKKFSAEEDDDKNLFVQWSDDITDTLSGLWWTGTFLKLLISSALTGRAKKWFDSTTEGIDDHSIRTYTLEKFLALLSGEFDGVRVLRRESFAELLKLSINSETSLEKFAKISEFLTPYYLSSSAALDLFLTKLKPCLRKQLGDAAFPMTLDIALLVAACEFAKGTSEERKDKNAENNNNNNNSNPIDLDASMRKKRDTVKTAKKCKRKSIHENIDNAIKKSNGKKNLNEEELQVLHPKRRKQNESGKQISLPTAALAKIIPLNQNISNINASNKQFNASSSLDSYTSLKSNSFQHHLTNETPILDGNRSFPITTPAAASLAYDKVENIKNETNIHDEAINDIPLSLASSNDFVKKSVAESMSWKSIRGNVGVPDSNVKSFLRGDESNHQMARRSHATHVSSHSNIFKPGQTACYNSNKTNFTENNKMGEINNLNPFTKNENTIKSDKSKGPKNPVTSMKVNKPSYFIDLEKPQSMHNENRSVGLLAQKSYPLHNFAVRTRNARFNDRPSNYTSAHGNLNAIHPLSLKINNIQCLSKPGKREADTNKEVNVPKMTVQEKGTVNSIIAKDSDGRSNSVENPFLGNTLNETKLNSYYI